MYNIFVLQSVIQHLYSYFSEFHSGCIYTTEKILLVLSRTRYSLNKLTVQVTKHHPLLQLNVFNFATNHNSSNFYNPVSSLPNSIVGGRGICLYPPPASSPFLTILQGESTAFNVRNAKLSSYQVTCHWFWHLISY